MTTSSRATTLRVLLACVVAPGLASADRVEILGPTGPVSPDGFSVGVLVRGSDGRVATAADVSLDAEGAMVKPEGKRGAIASFEVAPNLAVKEVRLRARGGGLSAERTFGLGSSAARLALSLSGSAPVKGRDAAASIDVRILRADGSVDPSSPPPVVRANVGRIEALERVQPGHFRARYLLPTTRYPEVAVLVAFAPWPHPDSVHGAVGTLLVPLASAIELPGRTERNAQMSIEIAGVPYGPVRAGPDGRFLVPVVVPPGHRYGKGTAVDRAGNKRVSRVDLLLPPTDQLACVVNPARLPADGRARARVVCATSDPYGAPQAHARVELAASAGERGALRSIGEGLVEWLFTAPAKLESTSATLTATWREGSNLSREEMRIELAQGPAAALQLSASESVAYYGGGPVSFEARVTDRLGRPRDGAAVTGSTTVGEISRATPKGGGLYAFSWTPPPPGTAEKVEVAVRAFGPTGALPSRLVAWMEREGVFVSAVDLADAPVPDQPIRIGDRIVKTGADGVAGVGPLSPGIHEVRHEHWTGLRLTLHAAGPGLVWPLAARPGAVEQRLEVLIAPPIPVNVRVAIAGREITWWAEDAAGRLLADRQLAVRVEGGQLSRPRKADGRTSATMTGKGPAHISVADVETGITAIAEVPP